MNSLIREKHDVLQQRAARALPAGIYGHMGTGKLPAGYPQFFERAQGARVWDVDGNEYIDFTCAYGPNLLGYRHPKVDEAVRCQMAQGDIMTGPSPLAIDLAEALNERGAHADWSMFCKNGTDATTICVMAARAQTGRRIVLMANGSYHGIAGWSSKPGSVGVVESDKIYVLKFEYNDIDSLNAAVESAGDDLAAIVLTPFKQDVFVDQEWPTLAFATAVREVCDERSAALILDDVRCTFRFSMGSTWDEIGVLPDLCAMGKSLGNGYALSAVSGNNKFRDGASQIYATGSFWFSAVSFAASLATIAVVEEEDVIKTISEVGAKLRNGLDQQAAAHGFKLRQTGPVQMPMVVVDDDSDREKTNFFCSAANARGVYLHPWHNMFVCAAHEQAIDEALDRTDDAFKALKQHYGDG